MGTKIAPNEPEKRCQKSIENKVPKKRLPEAMTLIDGQKALLNYGKRECAIPLGRRKPIRGSLRGMAKDRAAKWIFLARGWKRSEKVQKDRKMFKKIGKGSASLIQTCFRGCFFLDF